MLDRERILAKIDELEGYLHDLRTIAPASFTGYQQIEKKRACERLLQIAVECVIDVCGLVVSGLRLGLPAEEDDIFAKLARAHILTPQMQETVRKMKGFRNILAHVYGAVDDAIVYHIVTVELDDFTDFRREILAALQQRA